MKKTSKRILSVVLSLIMVVTMLPLSGIIAFASASDISNHLVGRYLVDGVTNFLDNDYDLEAINGGGVTWTAAASTRLGADAAVFEGGKKGLMISKSNVASMFADTSKDIGFTIAFRGSRGGAWDWKRFFDFDNGDGPYNSGTTTSLEFGSNATVRAKYNDSVLGDISVNGDTYGAHNWVITAKGTTLTAYCDGEVSGTALTNLDASWFTTLLGGSGQLLIGASPWDENGFNGQIRDFRIYDKGASADEAAAISDDITAKLNETTPSVSSTDYWQQVASTDFTKATWYDEDDNDYNVGYRFHTNNIDDVVSTGDKHLKWNAYVWEDIALQKDASLGVKSYNGAQTFLYLTGYDSNNDGTFNSSDSLPFDTNFKIDLEFQYTGTTLKGSDTLNGRAGDHTPIIKLSTKSSSKFAYAASEPYDDQFFAQEAWGRIHTIRKDGAFTDEGGTYSITTQNSLISTNTTYHYVMYFADGMMGSYVADANGDPIIIYKADDCAGYSSSSITGFYIGNARGHYLGNVAYKSVKIYKGEETSSSYDSTRSKYLLTYFTDNNAAGETLHYALSDDGVNFEAVNNGTKVWDSGDYNADDIAIWPKGDRGIDTSLHVRDPYVLRAQDGSYYILATDLNTHPNGESASAVYSNGSKVLVWHLNDLADIPDTEPWVIDGTNWKSIISENSALKRMWAPQAIWDTAKSAYMFYFAAGTGSVGSNRTYMYYTYTTDFKSFTTPKRLLFDGSNDTIDGDITYYKGLYYMWYKNENNSGTGAKHLYQAVAPAANGPYTNITAFDNSTPSLEGPSVYQTGATSYAMLADAYDGGSTNIFSATTPYGFSSSGGSSTNVVSELNYRHGCVTPITTTEYNKLKALVTGGVKYKWNKSGNASTTGESATGTLTDSTGNTFIGTWNQNSQGATLLNAENGTLVCGSTDGKQGGVYMQNDAVTGLLQNEDWTITFDFTLLMSSKATTDYTVFNINTLGSANTSKRFIRLDAYGNFYIDGSSTPVGRYTGSMTTKHTYTITHNSYSTSLLVDDTYVCGGISTTTISAGRVELGWGDYTDSTYGYKRISGEYGPFTGVKFYTDTDHEDELYDDLEISGLDDAAFEFISKYFDDTATDAYSNVVYATTGSSGMYQNTGDPTEAGATYYKVFLPLNTVLVYDGPSNGVFSPIVAETKRHKKALVGSQKICYIASKDSTLYFDQLWDGFIESDWTKWPTTTTNHFGYLASQLRTNEYDATNDTSRFWRNKLVYHGTGDKTNYYEKFSNLSFTAMGYYDNWGDNTGTADVTTTATNYVINYYPVKKIIDGTEKIKAFSGDDNTYTAERILEILNDENERWKYTTESCSQALYALYMLENCDPNNYTYADRVDAGVKECAADIKEAVSEFNKIKLVKKTFTFTCNMVDGTTIYHNVTAGNTFGTVSHTNAYHLEEGDPSYDASVNKHRVGTGWEAPGMPSSDSIPRSGDTVFTETGNVYECDELNDMDRVGDIGDDNGYTNLRCSVCNAFIEQVYDSHDEEWAAYYGEVGVYIDRPGAVGVYTTDSVNNYVDYCDAHDLDEMIEDVIYLDETKSADYIEDITDTVETVTTTAKRYLVEVADFDPVDDAVTPERTNQRNTNNYNGANQIYTYRSWMEFAPAYDHAKTYVDYNASTRNNTPMYEVNGSNYKTETLSTAQQNINDYADALNDATLTAVDSALAYTTYEDAKTLVNSTLDTRKYTADGIAYINAQINSADGSVYHTLVAGSDLDNYNAYTGGGHVAGEKIKNLASGVDSYTGTVLSASTTLNSAAKKDEYIKKYTVSFTIQNDAASPVDLGKGEITVGETKTTDKASVEVPFGDKVSLAVPSSLLSSYSVALWSASNKDDSGTVTGSQKVSGDTNNQVFDKIVSGNIAVVAELSSTAALGENNYRYNICNAYGNVIDVQYGTSALTPGSGLASVTVNGETLTAQEIPFYSFRSWTVTSAGNNTFKVRPVYTTAQRFNFSAVDGTITATQDYDKRVYYNYTGNDTFKAWAVKKGEKYQIASYNTSGYFFACQNEAYVPVVFKDSTYKVKLGADNYVTLAASDIDGEVASVGDADKNNALVYDKIANKKPFVSIENAMMTDGNKKARVYARVTAGATGSTAYGLLIYNGSTATLTPTNATLNRTITTILETGQYTYTLNNSKGFSKPVTFRTYIDYDATYTYNSNNYTINARDYSAVVEAVNNA